MRRVWRSASFVFAGAVTAGIGVTVPAGAAVIHSTVIHHAGGGHTTASAGWHSAGWHGARGLPGAGALNQGRSARVWSVTCPAAGDCTVTGQYTDGAGHHQVFVASETNGTWGTAEELPGLAALNAGGAATPGPLSCASAGDCTTGGKYTDGAGHPQAFMATETNGTWGQAEEVPGSGALNTGGTATLTALSCPVAGGCTAGGTYTDGAGHQQVFVIGQVNGAWGAAEELPGSGALNQGGTASLSTISCPTVGNCVTGGGYTDNLGGIQAFLATETGSVWGDAEGIPSVAGRNVGYAQTKVVSCRSVGNCTVVGTYTDGYLTIQSFDVSETNGTWGTASKLPGTGGPDAGPGATVQVMSCSAVGDCNAGGYYNAPDDAEAFVATETGGTWGKIAEVPGVGTLGDARRTSVTALSCASPGNCSAGGYFHVTADGTAAFVTDEIDGVWQQAEPVPGFGGGTAFAVHAGALSCSPAGSCTAGGANYRAGGSQAYIASTVSPAPAATVLNHTATASTGTASASTAAGAWGTAQEVPGTDVLNQGDYAIADSVSCPAAGDCTLIGQYDDSSGARQLFVTSETKGVWGQAAELPGIATLNAGGLAWVDGLSCASVGNCSAAGVYDYARHS